MKKNARIGRTYKPEVRSFAKVLEDSKAEMTELDSLLLCFELALKQRDAVLRTYEEHLEKTKAVPENFLPNKQELLETAEEELKTFRTMYKDLESLKVKLDKILNHEPGI